MKLLVFIQKLLETVLNIPFLGRLLDLYLSWCGSVVRWFAGSRAAPNLQHCQRPVKTLIYYQYEGCPYCRLVRESISVLALDVEVRPCPRTTLSEYGVSANESRFRPEAVKLSGKCMFPLLVDPNFTPPMVLPESRDIVNHLWEHYGKKASEPWNYRRVNTTRILCALPTAFRCLPAMGLLRTPSKAPGKELIEIFSYDACPYSRLIRESLDSLELPYLLHNYPIYDTPQNQRKTLEKVIKKYDVALNVQGFTTPLLIDPNTSKVFTNSAKAVRYLFQTYAIGKAEANWADYSTKGASASHGTIPGFKKD